MEDELKNEMIKSILESKEFFFIGKFDGVYKLLHSDLSECDEWVDMIEHFKDKLEEKITGQRKDRNALEDLLGDEGINLN